MAVTPDNRLLHNYFILLDLPGVFKKETKNPEKEKCSVELNKTERE